MGPEPVQADPPSLDAPAIFAILDTYRVEYVLVGGYAAQVHGSTRVTTDVDVTPERSLANLGRLAAALRELGGGIRVDDLEDGLPFATSAEALAGVKTLNLRTPFGDIDLTFDPDGTGGFPDLVGRAEPSRTPWAQCASWSPLWPTSFGARLRPAERSARPPGTTRDRPAERRERLGLTRLAPSGSGHRLAGRYTVTTAVPPRPMLCCSATCAPST